MGPKLFSVIPIKNFGTILYKPGIFTGNEFGEKMVEQVLAQEADVECAEVLEIKDGVYKTVVTDSGDFAAKAIVIATGAKHRLLGLPGEEKYIGEGISFCAVCDGAFYEGKEVAVIGGGNSALQEAILLADLAKKVTVVQNLDFLTGEKKLQDKLATKSNVEVILGTVVDSFIGGESLEGIRIRKEADGTVRDLMVDGVFVAIGLVPQNEVFAGLVPLDGRGYIISGEDCLTGKEGVFAAGDCRTKAIRQVTTAVADGAVAALAACAYADNIQ